MADEVDGCVTPSAGPIETGPSEKTDQSIDRKEVSMTLAKVGKAAPDFELGGFHAGGFKNFKLSDYKGKWIVLCFYPGDFTFV